MRPIALVGLAMFGTVVGSVTSASAQIGFVHFRAGTGGQTIEIAVGTALPFTLDLAVQCNVLDTQITGLGFNGSIDFGDGGSASFSHTFTTLNPCPGVPGPDEFNEGGFVTWRFSTEHRYTSPGVYTAALTGGRTGYTRCSGIPPVPPPVGCEDVSPTPFGPDQRLTVIVGEGVEKPCDVVLTVPVIIRAKRTTLTATVDFLTPGAKVDHVEWIFEGGKGGSKNSRTTLRTSVVLVDGDGSYAVTVRVFTGQTTLGCSSTSSLDVQPRTGPNWTITPKVRPDNERHWGDLPTCASALLGLERDRRSNSNAIIVPSPEAGSPWERGYRVGTVRDPGGPNDGYSYVRKAAFAIDQETVINRWLKPKGPLPEPRTLNWHQHNGEACAVDPGAFLAAAMGHENSGSRPGSTGHFGLIRDAIESDVSRDPRNSIETMFAPDGEAQLVSDVNTRLELIEGVLQSIAGDGPNGPQGNWEEGDLDVSFWDPTLETYSECECFNRGF